MCAVGGHLLELPLRQEERGVVRCWWAEGCFGGQKRCFPWDAEEMEPLESSGSEIRQGEVGPRPDGVILAAGTGSHPD